jgi:threonine/homoserine/homoserine lactone efflux protein
MTKDLATMTPLPLDLTASALTGFGIGIALASAPGPVQAVILAEAVRGGPGRGLRAVAGASLSFGTLLIAMALGLSALAVSGAPLRILQVLGGAFLLWLAADGFRAGVASRAEQRPSLPPAARGSLAVLINPGAWLFLGAVAAPLLGLAATQGGTAAALATALALMAGAAIGDTALALLGGIGLRRAGPRPARWTQRGLAVVLAGLGVLLLVSGIRS